VIAAEPLLRHIVALTDEVSIFEHAAGARPRSEHGYCVDDAGRALALVSRLENRECETLANRYLSFLESAAIGGGRFRLRMSIDGRWSGESDDGSARALLGIATALVHAPWLEVRERARSLWSEAQGFSSVHPRALSYVVLAAAEVLRDREDVVAREIVDEAHQGLPGPRPFGSWPWPEPRLTYANALIPHALAVLGELGGDDELGQAGRWLLRWLIDRQWHERHFSFVPVGGAAVDDRAPRFDQQPIEAWTTADACAHAFAITRDAYWRRYARAAAAWFLGDNDSGLPVFDQRTGGGYDAITREGVNTNQGAESTLAYVSTMTLLARLTNQGSAQVYSAPVATSRATR